MVKWESKESWLAFLPGRAVLLSKWSLLFWLGLYCRSVLIPAIVEAVLMLWRCHLSKLWLWWLIVLLGCSGICYGATSDVLTLQMRNCTPDRWSNLSKVTQAICVRARIQTCLWAPAFWNILPPTGSISCGWNATIYAGEMPLVLSICLWGGAIMYRVFWNLMEFQQSWRSSLSVFFFWISFCYCSVFYVQQIQTNRCVNDAGPATHLSWSLSLCANTQNQALSSVPLPESYPGDHRTSQYPCPSRSNSCRSSLGTVVMQWPYIHLMGHKGRRAVSVAVCSMDVVALLCPMHSQVQG